MSRLAVLLMLCAVAPAQAGGHSHGALRRGSPTDGFVRPLEFKRKLRVCNAYPDSAALEVYRGKSEKLTNEAMPYKTCKDFDAPLQSGDKLAFKVGDVSSGTFAVSDLPNNDAVLLLVVHRHDALSTAVSFESHIFANLQSAQVAVIDAYKGKARGVPRIMDVKPAGKKSRSEELRYESVVGINPGVYDVALYGQDGKSQAKNEFVALQHESYIVLRTGIESQRGPSYPEELVVFPKSDVSAMRNSAPTKKLLHLVFMIVLACIA